MGLVMVSPEEVTIEKSLRLRFLAMNNKAEYEALLEGIVHGSKNGRKGSGDVLEVKIGRRPSEGRFRSKR